MKEIGAEIQQARLAKGIKLEEIVHHTHIQLAHLQKIENGQLDFLPRPYVTAFIKTFAQNVGLDGDALVNRWHEQEQAEALRLQQQERRETEPQNLPKRQTPATLISLKPKTPETAVALPLAFPYLKEVLLGLGMLLMMAVIVFFVSRAGGPETEALPDDAVKIVKIDDPAQLQETPIEELAQQQQAAALKAEPATPPPATNELILQAQFAVPTRIRVVRDGRDTVRSTLYRVDQTPSWSAKEQFNLRITPGGAVTLTLAGKNLGKFGVAGQIEYLTITAAGVTSRRAVTPTPPKPRDIVPLDSMPIRRPQGFD